MVGKALAGVAGAGLLLVLPVWGQVERRPSAAAALERAGRYEEAARAYAELLDQEPALPSALLGLERTLSQLGRLGGIREYLSRALDAEPRHPLVRELEFRVAVALDGPDSVRAVALRWMRAVPDSPEPYRQLALWLVERDAAEEALEVLDRAEMRLGAEVLAPTRAQLLVGLERWLEAAEQWGRAVSGSPGYVAAAGASLARAPEEERGRMLELWLGRRAPPPVHLLAADLLVRWDRPEEAWVVLDRALPPREGERAAMLARFAAVAGELGTAAGFRARGYALERLAEQQGAGEALRTRIEAARAFAEAGDVQSAQRLLDRRRLRAADPRDEAAAMATLIRVWIESGRLQDAEEQLSAWEGRLSAEDGAVLRQRLAWEWVRRAEVARAREVLGADSTVGAQAVRGWLALFQGDLEEARVRFRRAGPQAQSREEATRRAHVLVLLERITAGRLPELGAALLMLAQGDTAGAVGKLRAVAGTLPVRQGRQELLFEAGELAAAARDYGTAEALLEEALAADPAGPVAPAAAYALAVVYVETGRPREALARLEELILTFGESAVVPQARRLLEQVRGAIPRS